MFMQIYLTACEQVIHLKNVYKIKYLQTWTSISVGSSKANTFEKVKHFIMPFSKFLVLFM